jgi:hypothetical protein
MTTKKEHLGLICDERQDCSEASSKGDSSDRVLECYQPIAVHGYDQPGRCRALWGKTGNPCRK